MNRAGWRRRPMSRPGSFRSTLPTSKLATMTATRTPGQPFVDDGKLVSTNPATGDEVGRFPVATAAEVEAAVSRARGAGVWWAGLGFAARRARLHEFRAVL